MIYSSSLSRSRSGEHAAVQSYNKIARQFATNNVLVKSAYEIWLPGTGHTQRRRIRGDYEREVMETIADNLDSDSIFWEVGAGWGYFSLAAANIANRVFAFESHSERAELISRSIERNGYENVEVVQGLVGGDVDLATYPSPDVVLMDIEGWEYTALDQCLPQMSSDMKWVVEIHEPKMVNDGTPVRDGKETLDLFRDNGYQVEELDRRSDSHWHMIAY